MARLDDLLSFLVRANRFSTDMLGQLWAASRAKHESEVRVVYERVVCLINAQRSAALESVLAAAAAATLGSMAMSSKAAKKVPRVPPRSPFPAQSPPLMPQEALAHSTQLPGLQWAGGVGAAPGGLVTLGEATAPAPATATATATASAGSRSDDDSDSGSNSGTDSDVEVVTAGNASNPGGRVSASLEGGSTTGGGHGGQVGTSGSGGGCAAVPAAPPNLTLACLEVPLAEAVNAAGPRAVPVVFTSASPQPVTPQAVAAAGPGKAQSPGVAAAAAAVPGGPGLGAVHSGSLFLATLGLVRAQFLGPGGELDRGGTLPPPLEYLLGQLVASCYAQDLQVGVGGGGWGWGWGCSAGPPSVFGAETWGPISIARVRTIFFVWVAVWPADRPHPLSPPPSMLCTCPSGWVQPCALLLWDLLEACPDTDPAVLSASVVDEDASDFEQTSNLALFSAVCPAVVFLAGLRRVACRCGLAFSRGTAGPPSVYSLCEGW
jgi:hypothetical protein